MDIARAGRPWILRTHSAMLGRRGNRTTGPLDVAMPPSAWLSQPGCPLRSWRPQRPRTTTKVELRPLALAGSPTPSEREVEGGDRRLGRAPADPLRYLDPSGR